MPVVVDRSQLPELDPNSPRRKKWTREEFAFFVGHELFAGQNYELIEGELIDKRGKNWPHINVLRCLVIALTEIFGADRILQEASIFVAEPDNPFNEPEPDLVVLRQSLRSMRDLPGPGDVVLIAEVADSTLSFDLRTKARLYARAQFAEYWVLDINSRALIVHREPRDGQYQSIVRYTESESVSPLASPGRELEIRAAFPAPE
jgi:Uma2 family endonuclease